MSKRTINDIFRDNEERYRRLNPHTSLPERKVIRSISLCRTDEIGARIEKCDTCGHRIILNNSCRNRHCPQCQNLKKEEWIAARKSEVLPVTYFHIVFTVPHILNELIWKNKKLLFNLMFRISKETLLSIAAEEKYFGADIGFFSVLHTWGQKLNQHPHIHCVFPGGGFSTKGGTWVHVPNDYFAPIDVVKARYRDLFIQNLKHLYKSGELYCKGSRCENPAAFKNFIDDLYAHKWVVFLKESFKNSDTVIEYLARYTHKIAITNYRIVSVKDCIVSFTYRDYKDDNRKKIARMDVMQFMRKFLLHTVPYRFVRIRYYGIFSHRNKQQSLETCRKLYGILGKANQPPDWKELLIAKTGVDYSLCPACGMGRLVFEKLIQSRLRSPPQGFEG